MYKISRLAARMCSRILGAHATVACHRKVSVVDPCCSFLTGSLVMLTFAFVLPPPGL